MFPTLCVDSKQRESKERGRDGAQETSASRTEFNSYKTATRDPFLLKFTRGQKNILPTAKDISMDSL